MKAYTAVIERCMQTGLYVGYVPAMPGAHSQGATIDELSANLREVLEMLADEGESEIEGEFVGTQVVSIGRGRLTPPVPLYSTG